MQIKTKSRGDCNCLIVKLSGELDMASVDKFRKVVIPKLENNNLDFLLLNLTEVNFIDSTGLGAILGRYRVLAKRDGGVLLVGMKPQVERIFSLSGMLKIMESYQDEKKALASLKKGEYNLE